MHTTLAIMRKELRAYFNSPLAYVFLLLFTLAALFVFFRDVWALDRATLRPMLDWLPGILLLLVPALTMRLWSEERKLGTLEVLLTMPVRDSEVVIGKFLASFILCAIALGLTLGAPITLAIYGPLDWGPVIGGYAAALCVAASYLAIGLFVSALTENQVLAFLGAFLLCGVLWLVGEHFVTSQLGASLAGGLEKIGTGARFRSVARGVLDLRDMVYYLSIVVVCLVANACVLKARREG